MIRISAGLLVLLLTLLVASCGSDDEPDEPDAVRTAPTATAEETATERPPTGTREASPEDQPGGAGDEEPARSEAVLEISRAGALSPKRVQVAPFIAVKLILRPARGRDYEVTVRGPAYTGQAGGNRESDLDLEGLRPGQQYEVEENESGSRALIVASDDVGP